MYKLCIKIWGYVMEEEYLTIFQLTQRIKKVINFSPNLKNVCVKGEVSRVSPSNQITFLDLKDENSMINCVIYPRVFRNLDFELEKGMHVLVKGTVDMFPKTKNSSFHLKINRIERDGLGDLYIAYKKLYVKLEKLGYFDESKKKPIPKFPKRIGVVTSPNGEAIRDILSKVGTRWPLCEVILFPSLVQGNSAPPSMIKQIKRSVNFNLDVLIIGRGGGSPEDLWCFNDEDLAKAIYDCPIPVISAIGHKRDHHIADDVADLKAATPTDVGEKVVPDINEVQNRIDNINSRINSKIKSQLELNKGKFNSILKRRTFINPYSIYEEKVYYLGLSKRRLSENSKDLIHSNRNKFNLLRASFIFKDPDRLLEKKSRTYNILVKELGVNSKNFVYKKGNDLKRLKDSFILKNPNKLFKDKSKDFNGIKSDLGYYSNKFIFDKERKLDKYKDSYILNNPKLIIKEKSRDYNDILRDLDYCSNKLLKSKEDDLKEIKNNYIIKNPDKLLIYEKNTVGGYMEKLLVLNPLNTLKRGYTITKHDDKVISSKKDLEIGDELEVNFDDGSVNTKVVDLKNDNVVDLKKTNEEFY